MATAKKSPVKKVITAKKTDFSGLSKEDLIKKIAEIRTECTVLKRNTLLGDVQNVKAYGAKRKELARALTAINSIQEGKE
jgi:ribosomal protein L29